MQEPSQRERPPTRRERQRLETERFHTIFHVFREKCANVLHFE
jgi:hypothetical protein